MAGSNPAPKTKNLSKIEYIEVSICDLSPPLCCHAAGRERPTTEIIKKRREISSLTGSEMFRQAELRISEKYGFI
mgnify:CR=1 FL=1